MSESPQSSRSNGDQGPDRRERLEQGLAAVLDRAIEELRQQAGEKFRHSDELTRLIEEIEERNQVEPASTEGSEPVGDSGLGPLLAAVARIDGQTQQSEILGALIEEALRYSSRVAFFLNRPEGLVAWGARGFGGGDERLAGLAFDHGSHGSWADFGPGCGVLSLSAADCARLSAQVDVEVPADGVLVPFELSGQLAGVLYADSVDGDGELQIEGLQLLTHAAAEALETLPFRGSGGSPALRQGTEGTAEVADVDQDAVVDQSAADQKTVVEQAEEDSAADIAKAAAAGGAVMAAGAAAIQSTLTEEESAESADEQDADAAEPDPGESPATAPVSLEPIVDDLATERLLADEPATVEVHTRDEDDQATVTAAPDTSVIETGDEAFAAAEEVTSVTETVTLDADEDESLETAVAPRADVVPPEVDSEIDMFQTADGVPFVTGTEPEPEVEVEVELEDSSELWLEEDEDEPPPVAGRTSDPSPLETAAAGQQTVRIDAVQLEDQGFAPPAEVAAEVEEEDPLAEDDTSPVPVMTDDDTHVMEQPQLETGFELEPDESSANPVGSEDPTMLGMPAIAAPPPSAGFAAPAPPSVASAVSPTQSGSTEVAAPLDLTGPGLAFSTGRQDQDQRAPVEEALHEEARRLARLLVSEIKLYNEEVIEEGRRDRNIYERLREDIDRSRQMFDERIDQRVREHEDYFLQEMVRLLAGGDAALLGL